MKSERESISDDSDDSKTKTSKTSKKKVLPCRYKKYKYNVQGLTKELSHKPDILQFIFYLQRLLIHRKKKFEKLKHELKKIQKKNKIDTKNASTQTDEVSNETQSNTWNNSANEAENCTSIADMVKEAAENAMQQTGMVFEKTSGMYYDYNTGYYYNPVTGLYYHSSTGCYYYYDKEQNTFTYHSQADASDFPTVQPEEDVECGKKNKEKRKEKKKKRKSENTVNEKQENLDDSTGNSKKGSKRSCKSNKNNEKPVPDDEQSSVNDDKNDVIIIDVSTDKAANDECVEKNCNDENCDHKRDDANAEESKMIKLSSDEEGLLTETSGDELDSSSSDESVSNQYPPCMRIIVNETSVDSIKIGSLFIVTKEGGTLGREGKHSIIIPDENISRHHLTFEYNDEKKSYYIKDIGSRNGTLLNGKILSNKKEESEFLQIVHGSIIQIGSTKLLCHIHKGNDTCGHCEPGLLIKETKAAPQTYRPLNMKSLHKQELRRLKDKYKVLPVKSDGTKVPLMPEGYEDKAQLRREKVGSTHHAVKTEQACLETNIASTNKGYKMLEKMGWSAGEGLGKSTAGRTEPVALVSNVGTSGLGSGGLTAPSCSGSSLPSTSSSSWKQGLWRTTQKRFDKATTSSFFNVEESDEEESVQESKQTN